ncbi:MAG: DUF1080 domain-containing protein [Planctomycetota bacterium]
MRLTNSTGDTRWSRRTLIKANVALATGLTLAGPLGTFLSGLFLDHPERQLQAADAEEGWRPLFDGKSLTNWKPTRFGGDGEIHIENGELIFEQGSPLTGLTWTKEFPKQDFEISLEAKRVEGSDFFVGLTFPVRDSHASFIVGGWAGSVVGISCIDGHDASDNNTTKVIKFDNGKWYKFKVQVRADRIKCWIDGEAIIDEDIKGKRIHTRNEVDPSRPLGIATFETKASLKNFQYRVVK